MKEKAPLSSARKEEFLMYGKMIKGGLVACTALAAVGIAEVYKAYADQKTIEEEYSNLANASKYTQSIYKIAECVKQEDEKIIIPTNTPVVNLEKNMQGAITKCGDDDTVDKDPIRDLKSCTSEISISNEKEFLQIIQHCRNSLIINREY